MVRLVPRRIPPKKEHYNNIDEVNWLINNDRNLDDINNGKQKFNKGFNGRKAKK